MSGFHSVPSYVALPKARDKWIVQDLIPAGGSTLIYGPPKRAGKSFFAVQLCAAISDPRAEACLSFPVKAHGPVCYLQVDTPRWEWSDRLSVLEASYHTGGLDHLIVADREADGSEGEMPYPFDILREGGPWLRAQVDALQPLAVVIDTLRDIHSGDENDSMQMRNVVTALQAACHPAAVVLLAHNRKQSAGSDGPDDLMSGARGSSYLVGRVDVIIHLTRRQMTFQSRSCDETILRIDRNDDGHVILADAFHTEAVELAKTSGPGSTTLLLAKTLHERYPDKSLEACRHLMRTLRRRHGA